MENGSLSVSNAISKVRVDDLFGLYSYNLPGDSVLGNAAIFYGDNGVGKSTLLGLVYHLLSSAGNRGHRTALYNTEFSYLEVLLSNEVCVSAKRIDDGEFLRLSVDVKGTKIAFWDYAKDRSGDEIEAFIGSNGRIVRRKVRARKVTIDEGGVEEGESAFLRALKENAPVMYILNADRRLDSDGVADPSDEIELRRLMHFDTPSSLNQLVKKSREIGLSQALSSASGWISQKAIKGTNQGTTNVHSVYADVVKSILHPLPQINSEDDYSESLLVDKLIKIGDKSKNHSVYGLSTELSVDSFIAALESSDGDKIQLAANLLKPYVHSLEKKLEAIEPVFLIVDKFVSSINGFLKDKYIEYSLGQGFKIVNDAGCKLEASQLSSGEQQLLLLFCYVITARDDPSVFIIDEPEISLNVKWQRRLIQALLEITEGSKIQFIFASHSMELLAQHRDKVVKLGGS